MIKTNLIQSILFWKLQTSSDVSFLLRVLNLGVSAWEMISNQHFTEVALVSYISIKYVHAAALLLV